MQKLALERRVKITDLVEEIVPRERPRLPDFQLMGAGERPPLVAEGSVSNSSRGIAAQFTLTKWPLAAARAGGFRERRRLCPYRSSPVMRTVTSNWPLPE